MDHCRNLRTKKARTLLQGQVESQALHQDPQGSRTNYWKKPVTRLQDFFQHSRCIVSNMSLTLRVTQVKEREIWMNKLKPILGRLLYRRSVVCVHGFRGFGWNRSEKPQRSRNHKSFVSDKRDPFWRKVILSESQSAAVCITVLVNTGDCRPCRSIGRQGGMVVGYTPTVGMLNWCITLRTHSILHFSYVKSGTFQKISCWIWNGCSEECLSEALQVWNR